MVLTMPRSRPNFSCIRLTRRDRSHFTFSSPNAAATGLRKLLPYSRKTALRFGYDQPSFIRYLCENRVTRKLGPQSLDCAAVIKRTRMAIAGVAEGPDSVSVRGRNSQVDRLRDSTVTAGRLDETDGPFNRFDRIIVETKSQGQVEKQLGIGGTLPSQHTTTDRRRRPGRVLRVRNR